ncbi:MAG: response regulator [Candidatus Methanoplasma sp.]|nr:response regulator [Candidatus Methanoplasma sp.]
MRILIVDDNAALRDILAEVVSDAGHTAEKSPSVDAAQSCIGSFDPDVILLDIDMDGGRGLVLLDMMQKNTSAADIPVILIRSWNRQIPQDNSMIRGYIDKPFTGSDVLDSINGIQDRTPGEKETAKTADEPEESENNAPNVTLADGGIVFGRSYILFQSISDRIYNLIRRFGDEGYNVLVVTAKKKKTIIERFRNNDVRALTMRIKPLSGYLDVYGLGTMIDTVTEFVKSCERPVVAFDDLNKIISRNGMNSVLTSLHQLVTEEYGKEVTFLVSVDPKGFTVKDKEILLNHMTHYDPIGE